MGQNVSKLAEEYGSTPGVLSLAWLMQRPAVSTVIVGATRTEQLEDNLKSVEVQLDTEITEQLNEISDSFRYGKPFATYRLS
ncbi:putative aldo-keto reductase [compost metagenome]